MNESLYVYRFFDQQKYFDQFRNGEIRFGHINKYRKLENPRGDPYEGITTKIKRNQNGITEITGTTSLGQIYILSTCCSECDISYMKKKFGNYVIKIKNIEDFCNILKQKYNHDSVLFGKVEYYTLGDCSGKDVDIFRKHEEFSCEMEYRFAVILPPEYKEEHLNITIDEANKLFESL